VAPVIALTGFMGSGKTTVGKMTADSLGWTFVDLDKIVETRSGRSVPDIFAKEGETVFRGMESAALLDLLEGASDGGGLVLALGGGTLISPEVRTRLREGALVVYLEIDADEAWRRVSASDRPLARDRRAFADLLSERQALYEAAADHTVRVAGKSPGVIAGEVAGVVQAYMGEKS
jgi:shikimate kinase